MTADRCAYETDRLSVRSWHDAAGMANPPLDLAAVVTELLTEPVTHHLPESWRGRYSPERAAAWITERDGESPTLLAIERDSGRPVGLVILFESTADPGERSDVRLGYLLFESAWGRGLATELLTGLVQWCRGQPTIGWLSGGVARENEASQRVLERLGFLPAAEDGQAGQLDDELLYRLPVGDDTPRREAVVHRVVAAVLHAEERVLLCHRRSDRRWYPDVWDLPGGHVESDETGPEALTRELREELGIDIRPPAWKPIFADGTDEDTYLTVWAIDRWIGQPANLAPDEHDLVDWFGADELADLALAHPVIGDLCRAVIGASVTKPLMP